MELTKRKLQILRAVIEEYTDLAQPVGSRALSKRSDLKLSAATLRNEMADLEELGLLEKPHSSAGRRPTSSAYRLYVGSMLRVRPLSDMERSQLGDSFSTPMDEVRQVCGAAADAISKLTGCIAIVAAPSIGGTVLQRIQVVRVDEARIMALLITETGFVRHFFLPDKTALADKDLHDLSEKLTKAVAGVQFSKAGRPIDALRLADSQSHNHVIHELLTAINRNKDEMEMYLDGRQNIWLHPEYRDWEKAKQFLALLDTREWLESMLRCSPDAEFTLRIGPEVDKTLPDLGVVTGFYNAGSGNGASFGVVGPARMNYPRILPILRDVGERMSAALGRLRAATSQTKAETEEQFG